MKILYAIQGTGNGHISRARDIIPVLLKLGELDILVSGTESEVELPYSIKYTFKGLSFVFGNKGGIDLLATYKKGKLKRLFEEVKNLPVEDYDLVINDFEPVSAWACRLKNLPCIGLSHQAAVINKKAPRPKKTDIVGMAILKRYAPVTEKYGFHFQEYDKDVFTPVIRSQVRQAEPKNNGHFTVYLPAYSDDRIMRMLELFPDKEWHVFSKKTQKQYTERNIHFYPVNNDAFIESMVNCEGILCGAGFETPAEALFLRKKLMVIPMKGQYEQQCNAAALKGMGVPVIKSLKEKHSEKIKNWIYSNRVISVEYPDNTEQIIAGIISARNVAHETQPEQSATLGKTELTAKQFSKLSLAGIIKQISRL